jgi:P4 family phage/plasmid primase-like protien
MSTSNKFSDILSSFSISKSRGTNLPCTHTRIGDKEEKIYGGSYSIPDCNWEDFMNKYYSHVFTNRCNEYLTECQLEEGPILVDLDFRYSMDITKRMHTYEHMEDLIQIYLEELKYIFNFPDDISFPIYIFERPNINILTDKELVKDGIHLIIGITCNHTIQCYLRERVIARIGQVWSSLPLSNDWDSVFDEGISKGSTNWQVFGSQKPKHNRYDLSYIINVSIDADDREFITIPECPKSFDLKVNFIKLSARYKNHPKFEVHNNILDLINNKTSVLKKKRPVLFIEQTESVGINDIVDLNTLNRAVNNVLSKLTQNDYHIKELHEYTQILPERFYEPGSHLENRKIAFGLKSTDERLFLSWVMLRSKASDFDYASIPDLKMQWDKFILRRDGITRRSILYFAQHHAPKEYEEVKKNTIQYYVDESIKTKSDYDIATVLYQMFKDKYLCSSIVHKKIWTFRNHRWVLDEGNTLRMSLSSDVHAVYQSIIDTLPLELNKFTGEERDIKTKKLCECIDIIRKSLKMAQHKNNIMREAMELFYDKDFIRRMDSNKFLMCFKNGVVDFKNKTFRPGYAHDYITKSTHITLPDLDKLDTDEIKKTIVEIDYFMFTLFPVESLKKYMWDHLASCLIGYKKEHVFNIYRGSGSNGKSILTELMSQTLGEYKGTVPITLVTDKRNTIGGTSSEVVALKGIRYAVMQEPSKDAVINEGVMKELTGGDPIQARALYCDSEIFEPQFNLVVCTNALFEIKSNDDGTWRRLKLVDFKSKFTSDGEEHTDDTKFIFNKDKSLKEKLPSWAPIFAALLIKRAFETEGEVIDCEDVLASSKKYRQNQDTISGFINDMIVPCDGQYVGKQAINQAFKDWFQSSFGNRRMPKTSEVHEAITKKFPKKNKKNQWVGIKIQPEDYGDEIEEINEN